MKINTLNEACHAAWRGSYRGLASQGWLPSLGIRGRCAMWGDEDRACAVGWLFQRKISKKRMNSSKNGKGLLGRGYKMAAPLQRWFDEANDAEREDFFDFLEGLMAVHDFGSSFHIQARMDEFGKDYGWEPPTGV